jgi:hypothetical protein
MSAIASFTKLEKSALSGLRDWASRGSTYEYLRVHGQEVADYRWSGYVLATLLPYLQETHQIELMRSEYGELAAYLCQVCGASYFIFTPTHKAAYLNQLAPHLFSETGLRQYFNEFNETNEPEMGKAMLDGVAAIQQSLAGLDDSSVIIFAIG